MSDRDRMAAVAYRILKRKFGIDPRSVSNELADALIAAGATMPATGAACEAQKQR